MTRNSNKTKPKTFPTGVSKLFKMLFNYEEQADLICFSDENDDFFPSDDQTSNHCEEIEDKTMVNLYPFEENSENEDESTTWVYWPLWN